MTSAASTAEIGTPLPGRTAWKVAGLYSNGIPFKWENPDVPNYTVGDWEGGYVAYLNGRIVRGRLLGFRIFRSPLAAAIAAERHYAERIEAVRQVNEAQRASESRDYPGRNPFA
jgi:hypothetical protein